MNKPAQSFYLEQLPALLRLASPALPVGGFSYSQGLEAAVEAGLVLDQASAKRWITDGLLLHFAKSELIVWYLQYQSLVDQQADAFIARDQRFRASRESAELLAETEQMGWSALQLVALDAVMDQWVKPLLTQKPIGFPSAMALLAWLEHIEPEAGLVGYAFSWVEAQASAAGKAIPLGQSAIQRLLRALQIESIHACKTAMQCSDDDIQTFSPGLAILSSRHEQQYTRLFRS
jgi:urease accessory protein